MEGFQVLLVILLGAVAGGMGALLGLGGGVFLVPLLTWLLDLPVQQAAGISLLTVIATSGAVSTGSEAKRYVNLRLGMLLMVCTSLGGLAGGLTAQRLSERTLTLLFALTTAAIALVTLSRLDQRNVSEDVTLEPNWLGGRFKDPDCICDVVYSVRRVPLALGISFVAGNISGLLGVGGGVLQVPALSAWCGVPIRVAAATSAFLLGITALASAPLYYAHGYVDAHLAAAGVLGVLGGSTTGMRWGAKRQGRELKMLLAALLIVVSVMMFIRLAGLS
ncbi:MAG TPA: sulfite exporter TauE/SafE family protein [Vicinamibacterales bacterium]